MSQPENTIEDLFRDFTAQWVRGDADLATRTRYFGGAEQDELERALTPRTREHRQARIALARNGLAQLQRFDRASLNEAQAVSADVMQWQLQAVADEELFLDHSFPLEQFQGANVTLVNRLVVMHPLARARDAENYLAALAQTATRMDEAVAESRALTAKNILPPDFILQATIGQMRGFIATPPAENAFVATFAQKIAGMDGLSDKTRELLRAEAQKLVENQIYPAWRGAIALLQSQLPIAKPDAGLWRLPDGAAAYAYFLRRHTTTRMTPDQIHEAGRQQVEIIQRQMEEVLRRLGRTEGSVKTRIEKLRQDMTYAEPASDKSRAAIMRDIEAILRDAEKRAALIFDKTPKSQVTVQAVPRFAEANASPHYTPPASDGSRPGIFLYALRPEEMTKFGLRTTVYHETAPGHHFQIALQVENTRLPAFRQLRAFGIIAAHSEGWAVYAEHLAAESGWYEDDFEGLLGQLYWEAFRARRLVVDTGLHAGRWTRAQAMDYGFDAAEVERYVVNPGNASSYMIGMLKVLELREAARKALGDQFSLRGFHNLVLDTGTVPLDILERRVNATIAHALAAR